MSSSQLLFAPRTACRICTRNLEEELVAFLDLPVSGVYVSPESPLPDPVFPLTLLRCSFCGLVQLRESLSASFYSRYSFMSGVATGYKDYLTQLASHLQKKLQPGTRIIEIGCSDGTLLKSLGDTGFSVAGFEPAMEPAQAAQKKGLTVANEFLNIDSANRSGFESADVIIVRHVLEHIDDFPAIFAGIERLAAPDAILLIEVPNLTSTIEKLIYSNIYHIHPCYFDVDTMSVLLKQYDWIPEGSRIVDIFGAAYYSGLVVRDHPNQVKNELFRSITSQHKKPAAPPVSNSIISSLIGRHGQNLLANFSTNCTIRARELQAMVQQNARPR